ncbi:hypothetical protein CRE_09717 [Caenorhabditis remanei]|uniref:Uncharacterized protein n=1 Tax=Caenorhabditis remanei TaxID=31234 RepID=E3N4X5_CAERE|nr:hypothetical protein CRE_09717 [Caenorhabditis remanei]
MTTRPASGKTPNKPVKARKTEAERLREGLDADWFTRTGRRAGYVDYTQFFGDSSTKEFNKRRPRRSATRSKNSKKTPSTAPNNSTQSVALPVVPTPNNSPPPSPIPPAQVSTTNHGPPSPQLSPIASGQDINVDFDQIRTVKEEEMNIEPIPTSSGSKRISQKEKDNIDVILKTISDTTLFTLLLRLAPLLDFLPSYRDEALGLSQMFGDRYWIPLLHHSFKTKAFLALQNLREAFVNGQYIPPEINGAWAMGCSMFDINNIFKLLVDQKLAEIFWKLNRRQNAAYSFPILDDISRRLQELNVVNTLPRSPQVLGLDKIAVSEFMEFTMVLALLKETIGRTLNEYAMSEARVDVVEPIPMKFVLDVRLIGEIETIQNRSKASIAAMKPEIAMEEDSKQDVK